MGHGLGNARLAGVSGDEPTRQLDGGPGWAVGLGPAVPLDEIRVVFGERAEESRRVLDEAGKQHHAQTEAGRGNGRGMAFVEEALDRGAVRRPIRGPDDEVADAAVQGGPDVLQNRIAHGEIEEDLRATEALRRVAGEGESGRPRIARGRHAPTGESSSDRATHSPVAGDDAEHSDYLLDVV